MPSMASTPGALDWITGVSVSSCSEAASSGVLESPTRSATHTQHALPDATKNIQRY